MPKVLLLVVIDDWASLVVEDGQALAKCLDIVVGTLDERLACDVVCHGLLGRTAGKTRQDVNKPATKQGCNILELLVVRTTAGRVDKTAGNPRNQELVGDDEFNNGVKLLLARGKHGIKLLGLGDGSRETIEDKPGGICASVNRTHTLIRVKGVNMLAGQRYVQCKQKCSVFWAG